MRFILGNLGLEQFDMWENKHSGFILLKKCTETGIISSSFHLYIIFDLQNNYSIKVIKITQKH